MTIFAAEAQAPHGATVEGRTPMPRRFRAGAFALAAALAAFSAQSQAARPILDYHRLDGYFSLFAPDSNLPWKTTAVRLDTYTDAPLDFAAYAVDPADVIVAGANTRPRAIDTRRRTPIATWRFIPPGGYRFASNDVEIRQLGSREGFFVIEARRGAIGEQVWINRTRIGLLSKETADAITLYGADLGTGLPLLHMRVSFVLRPSASRPRIEDRFTDAHGIVRWRGNPRPIFGLAQWGRSFAFVSFFPQAPLPETIVAVKTDSAVVRAGESLRVVGFARSRSAGVLHASSGEVRVSLRSGAGLVTQTATRLDGAGAFTVGLPVGAGAPAGEYAVIASTNGASAGTGVHVDASAAGLSLTISQLCEPCDPASDVPFAISSLRAGAPAPDVGVDVSVVRSPHVFAPGTSESGWGMAQWFQTHVQTDGSGHATVWIPHPADGLASTYGVRAIAGGATAQTRIVVPTARIALRLQLDREEIGGGTPAAFEVYAYDVGTDTGVARLPVLLQLVHGASVAQQTLTLDAQGYARGVFNAPQAGSNLVVASARTASGQAMDAAQLQVEPQTMQMQSAGATAMTIALDRTKYVAGEEIHATAAGAGAQGVAIFTLESAVQTQLRETRVRNGSAALSFRAPAAAGALAIGAAFVRDGSLEWSTVPLLVDAPGRPISTTLALDRAQYAPGSSATVQLADLRAGAGTFVVRVTRGLPSGSALFDDAPELLAIGTTATQVSAITGASWHAWVDANGAHAQLAAFARRTAPPPDLTMSEADTISFYWKIGRSVSNRLAIPVPAEAGTYVVSLLKIDDDGRVAAASGDLVVR